MVLIQTFLGGGNSNYSMVFFRGHGFLDELDKITHVWGKHSSVMVKVPDY